ncbi:HIT domain-containing protein [Brevundimonas sp.]|uniref:HIT domain-containing protein n=1 Tax=Brevundimonas sp. TaxID=1871086 RepID=UPI001E0B3F2C|nr:HIT domain-containing protein [Brevundimonas sp.]MBA4001013.1 diadenosine tetraphosphate hydrolase [Brevundimonas sp.]
MTEAFAADPAFDAGSIGAANWPLCQVRLQDDARFPWLILIPRFEGLVELDQLTAEQRAVLMEETVRAGAMVRAIGQRSMRPVEKLNIAAIGNVTAQLHVHVVGRRRDDGLWPDPVWGRGPAMPYESEVRDELLAVIRKG